MPLTRLEASYNLSTSSQKGYRHDYGRSQSVKEGQGSVNGSQTDKFCHSEADNTVSPSNRADTATRSVSGHIQSQPESLKQCIAAQRVQYPCRSVEKLPEFLPDCKKILGPSQHLQATQRMASINGKEEHDAFNSRIEEKNPPPPKQVPKKAQVTRSRNSNVKKQPQEQNKGKAKAPARATTSQKFSRMPWNSDGQSNDGIAE
ncbi:hypothetical protein O181_119826 [Austropuccinia psidii MF-1]|uniref:Uncharacterized protein n=1 Tax=Austropuccinia psidii MF-1 TaxID=1389203 RepID=A0A9Q3KGI8_9BASI|nr:hypothetical protein [Austropuccinia psidii MF-1]